MSTMATLKDSLIATLRKYGADIVCCGAVGRMRDTAVTKIYPGTKSVVCAAFRQLRGARRGIEEGSTYYQYTTNAVETLEETVMPMALLKAAAVLEDHGYMALPQRRNQTVMQEKDSTNPEIDYRQIFRGCEKEPQLDFEQCAVDCGLGERGCSGSILTDDFGPFQRYVFILTDAELPADPVVAPHLCDRCGACAAACPGKAIDMAKGVDKWQCAVYYAGANMTKNPFMPPDAFLADPERLQLISGEARLTPERARAVLDQLYFYPGVKHGYKTSICGRACDIACYIHLEELGALKRQFHTPFRKREPWALPLI